MVRGIIMEFRHVFSKNPKGRIVQGRIEDLVNYLCWRFFAEIVNSQKALFEAPS